EGRKLTVQIGRDGKLHAFFGDHEKVLGLELPGVGLLVKDLGAFDWNAQKIDIHRDGDLSVEISDGRMTSLDPLEQGERIRRLPQEQWHPQTPSEHDGPCEESESCCHLRCTVFPEKNASRASE